MDFGLECLSQTIIEPWKGGDEMRKLPIRDGDFWIDHFYGGGSHPYFGVYEGNNLVCVCVYRKGAEEVLKRLAKVQVPQEGGDKLFKLKGGAL